MLIKRMKKEVLQGVRFDLRKKISGLFVAVLLVNAILLIAFSVGWSIYLQRNEINTNAQFAIKPLLEHIRARKAIEAWKEKAELNRLCDLTTKVSAAIRYVILYDEKGHHQIISGPRNLEIPEYKLPQLKSYAQERGSLSFRVWELRSKDNKVVGYVQLGYDSGVVREKLGETLAVHLGLIAVLLIVSVILTYRLATILSRPLREVIKVTQEVKAGESFREIEATTSDEAGVIVAIFNDMHRVLQARINDMASLQVWAMDITAELQKEELNALVVKIFADNTGCRRAALLLFDEKAQEFAIGGGRDVIKSHFRLKPGEGIAGMVRETGNYLQVNDLHQYPDYQLFYPEGMALPAGMELLALPIITRDKVIGVLELTDRNPEVGATFNREEILLFQTLTTSAGSALENARLYELAITDELTRLYVRRYYNSRLEEEIGLAAQDQSPLALLMLDIDHFKHFNDTYGHQTGDHVLQALARLMRDTVRGIDLKASVRRRDIVARYGGEEFSIILPHTPLEGAQLVAERLRANVEAFDQVVSDAGQILKITISLGVAMWEPGLDRDGLIRRADDALYESKRSGRNRITTWQKVDQDKGIKGTG